MVNKALDNQEIKVVNDQFGSPTFTVDIAQYILDNIESHENGVFHLVNDGSLTWFELLDKSFDILMLNNSIFPLSTKDFSSLVNRPLNSVLNSYHIRKLRKLELALQDYLNNYEL